MAEAIGQCPSVRPRAQRAMQGRRGLEGAKGTRYRGCVQASMQDVASNGEVSIDRPHEWVVISRSGESGWNERVESLSQTDVWYPEMWRG